MTDDGGRTKLLAKLQAILAKTTGAGATEAEAEAAVKLAQRLMAEHNVSLAEVEGFEAAQEDWETLDLEGDPGTAEAPYVMNLVQRFFFVRWVRTRVGRKVVRWRLFGTRENVQTAAWVAGFLRATFVDLWRARRMRDGCRHAPSEARSYYYGLYCGLRAKLEAERARYLKPSDGRALALVETKLDGQFRVVFGKLKGYSPQTTYDPALFQEGREAGGRINIARPVAGPVAAPALPSARTEGGRS